MDNTKVTTKKEVVTKLNDWIQVTVSKEDDLPSHITIQSSFSIMSLTLDEWHKVNSAIALALDKLGGFNG